MSYMTFLAGFRLFGILAAILLLSEIATLRVPLWLLPSDAGRRAAKASLLTTHDGLKGAPLGRAHRVPDDGQSRTRS